jgi:molybdopterin molybdotransferase
MLTVDQAMKLVLESAAVLPAERRPIEEAAGLVLAEEILPDADLPPFDRSRMDGYAVRSADTAEPQRALKIVGEVRAGAVSRVEVGEGEAARIFTGAPLPPGADAVEMQERTRVEGGRVILLEPVEAGRFVTPRGQEMRRGEPVLGSGSLLGAAEIGVLAAAGRADVLAVRPPTVAALATGNELVEAGSPAGPGQIRNSNSRALTAAARRTGAVARDLGIAPDEPAALRDRLREGMRSDLLLVTGGVAVGDYDLVEPTLEELGVEILFDRIRVKPGQHSVLGKHPGGLVLAVPGNPVSAYVGYLLFGAPALRKMRGLNRTGGVRATAEVTRGFDWPSGRDGFLPAWSEWSDGRLVTRRTEFHGSADLVSLARANSLIVAPSGTERYEEGDRVDVLLDEAFGEK